MKNIRRSQSGMTLLEVIISSSLLAVLLVMVIQIETSATKIYHSASLLNNSQMLVHMKMEDLFSELLETNPAYVWTSTFADPLHQGNTRQAIAFLSARTQTGEFSIINGNPSWQSVVLLCPYTWNMPDGTVVHELRRYEYVGVPSTYIDSQFVFTFGIDTSQITLADGIVFSRQAGMGVLRNLEQLEITGTYPLRISLSVQYMDMGSNKTVSLQSELSGRNRN